MKERLVGAAVLVAIAVWLIPWVLDGPEAPLDTGRSSLQLPAAEEPMPMRTQTLRLGDAPETAAAAQPAPVAAPPPAESVAAAPPAADPAPPPPASSDEAEQPVAVAAAVPEPVRAAPAPPAAATPSPRPAASAAPAPSGDWIVQLGSFGEEPNARRVAQRAGTFGYKADVSTIRSGGRTLYRVRVGPAQSRAAAEATASALKAHGMKDASVVAAR